jgi:PAS domain S-box-containing protein
MALLQHASDVITVLDAEGRVVYSSPAGQRLLGYPPGFWKGHTVFGLVHPDDAERVTDMFLRGIAEPGQTEPIQFRMRHADGSWRSMEAIGNNLLDDPAVEGMIVTTRDVTERTRAEEELRLLQTIVLAVNDAPDLSGALEVTIQRLCEVTGWACGAAWTPLPDGDALEPRRSWSWRRAWGCRAGCGRRASRHWRRRFPVRTTRPVGPVSRSAWPCPSSPSARWSPSSSSST